MTRVLALVLVLLAVGCAQARQTAFDAWGVHPSEVPPYELEVGQDEPDGLFSAQITDPGWTEQQAKAVAAQVIEERRADHSAIGLRFVSDSGQMIAAYARDDGGAGHLRAFGFDPADVESHGFPFLGFIRTEPEQPAEG